MMIAQITDMHIKPDGVLPVTSKWLSISSWAILR